MSDTKKVAILQSNYIPWKGYFDIINTVDEFIIYDSVQYTRQDWRNRNLIKTASGLKWLSVPVLTKEKYYTKPAGFKGKFYPNIAETLVANKGWAEKHWQEITYNYKEAPCFKDYCEVFEKLYAEAANLDFLSEINILFIRAICEIMGITTKISCDVEYEFSGGKSERLVELCQAVDTDIYLSGPAAKDYLDEERFKDAGIRVEWMDYSGYPEYQQLLGSFEHGVSILDLLFNCGDNFAAYMLSMNN